uniref:EamA domain-containing protein n=1 Tax=Amphora coffeiformis TaxID=265554 RepID=A0A7S3KW66_9STRA|mmetsp:Transcript_5096/g.10080  ORF Transcript_5096/g.10080 Transcript_5096/m.10080 type:complete len:500 (+) Transcript_5096:185-1684(+)
MMSPQGAATTNNGTTPKGNNLRSPESSHPRRGEKGLYEWLIFGAAIWTGTACSILSKVLYETTDEEGHKFDKPIAQTLAMFLAMILGVPIHWVVIYWKLPFPGYDRFRIEPSKEERVNSTPVDFDRTPRRGCHKEVTNDEEMEGLLSPRSEHDDSRIPIWTYFYLFVPAAFDCVATVLCAIGLLYLDVSIYQLLRGSGIIFVAILRHYYLGEHSFLFQWTGVGWNVLSVLLVGMAALLASSHSNKSNLEDAVIGVTFMLAGTMVQSMMFVFEEKVMSVDEDKVPPLLLFGMEGVWGTLITIFFLYPIGYFAYGNDRGSFEDPWSTWEMLKSTPSIQLLMFLYCLSIFIYNLFAVLVTFSLSSVWHSILDNFRPMTVWVTDLVLYYSLATNTFGEPWTAYSWIQLGGLFILVYGTMIYNAPDAGSIKLRGEWYSFGLDFSDEYHDIQAQRRFSTMGSYPSLQRFLRSRSRHECDPRIFMSMREIPSPKIHYGSLKEQHSI